MPKYVEVNGVVWQLEEKEYQYFDTRTAKGKKEEAEYLAKELSTPPNLVPIDWESVDDWRYLASLLSGKQLATAIHDKFRYIVEKGHGGVPTVLSNAVWNKSYEDHHSSGYVDVLQDYDEVLGTMSHVLTELRKIDSIRKIVDSIPLTALNDKDVIHFKDLLTKHL